jgi:hypothetical protein
MDAAAALPRYKLKGGGYLRHHLKISLLKVNQRMPSAFLVYMAANYERDNPRCESSGRVGKGEPRNPRVLALFWNRRINFTL